MQADKAQVHLVSLKEKLQQVPNSAHSLIQRPSPEQASQGLSRALRARASVTSVLLWATKESELLNAVCQGLVETGGYRFCWTEFSELKRMKSSIPIAWAGHEDWQQVTQTFRCNETGDTPAGVSIRTGRVCVVRDVPQPRPISLLTEESGNQSSGVVIALPLRADGTVLGALGIYALEPDALDHAETALLIELAEDLTRGIMALRNQDGYSNYERTLHLTQFAVDHAADACFWMGSDGQFFFVNETASRYLGYSRAELLSMSVNDIDTQLGRGAWLKAWAELKDKRVLHLESLFRRKDGKVFPVGITAHYLEFDGKQHNCIFVRDLTERKDAESRLRDREAQHRRLIDNIPEVAWRADEQGNALLISKKVTALFGYTPEEVLREGSKLWFGSMDPEHRESVRTAYSKLFGEKQPFDVEYRIRHRDGHWMWWHDRAILVEEKDGKCFADGLLSDITERKRLEEQFRQMQKMEAIGRLAGGIAHDFNNVLSVIMGYGELLRVGLSDEDPRARQVDEIKKAADRAASLTRQLLAFSRQQVLQLQFLHLNSIISELNKMLRRLIGDDIEMKLSLSSDLGTVKADVGQIEQVIMNLVINARDAMPGGGRLVIETANSEVDESVARQHPPMPAGSYVMLAVSDTGCGMAPHVLSHIFEPFFTTKEPGKGTGLGLSTVYGIVKQSEGFIWAYSEPGQGSVFRIYFPLVHRDAVQITPPETPVILAGGTETILVAEDEDALRSLAREMLEGAGYKILEAPDGHVALRIAKSHPGRIDLLLTDVVMEGMNGRELVEHMMVLRPQLRVLYMSGYTDELIAQRGVLETGITLLQKPFTKTSLLTRVRELLLRKIDA